MIYCNISDDSRPTALELQGKGPAICDELSAIIAELIKTDEGKYLVCTALKQSEDPEWQDFYDSEIRAVSDPNRRNKA